MLASVEQLRQADRWLPLRRLTPRGRAPIVLSMHDVRDAAWFGAMLDQLLRHFRFVDVDTMMSAWRDGSLEGDELLLTFDDGFRSVATNVEPACAQRGVPYLAFVTTEVLLGGPATWVARLVPLLNSGADPSIVARHLGVAPGPRWQVLARAKTLTLDDAISGVERAERALNFDAEAVKADYLTADMAVALHQGGLCTLGLHTHRHPTLASSPIAVQRDEIAQNVEALASLTGERARWFAYPNGTKLDYDVQTIKILKDLGVEGAFTTINGPLTASKDIYQIRRIGLNVGDSALKFVARAALPWKSLGMWREARCRVKTRRTGALK